MLIGEVAKRSGVSARMLRHYDAVGLIRPTGRTGTGYREYSSDDIRRIFHVESLRSLGLSLHDVGRALDDPDFTPADLVENLVRVTRERIARETELLTRLERVDSADPSDWEDVLRTVALLQDLGSVSAGKRQLAALSSAGDASDALVEAVLNEPAPNVAGAIRWALAQSADRGLERLEQGLCDLDPDVRRRAVDTVVELPGDDATAVLVRALTSDDATVRRRAALELGTRGVADAVSTLIDMVAGGHSDVEAADALTALANEAGAGESVVNGLVGLLEGDAAVRRRVAQALADVAGPGAQRALQQLAIDDDRAVALTAEYVLRRREV
ncbi:MAG: HEAT repeat domain-containing protein [Rhodococcus sp. (in: high G+C Gram-positive bacteria)]